VSGQRTPRDPQAFLAVLAAGVTVLLTAAAFWLSYEHLHDLAVAHGMARSTARAWAWPATVDLFIVLGELLVLRASLARRPDWFAMALTATGSSGSIALNVAGTGARAPLLDYIVSAIPPCAALLAFGALMRQIHAHLAERQPSPVPAGNRASEAYLASAESVREPASAPQETAVPTLPSAAPSRAAYSAPELGEEPYALDAAPASSGPVLTSVGARGTTAEGEAEEALQWALGAAEDMAGPDGRTRLAPSAEYVPEDQDIEPDPVPDPAEGTPDEDLATTARELLGEYLDQGRVPPIRAIRKELGIGQARAQRVQRLLNTTPALA